MRTARSTFVGLIVATASLAGPAMAQDQEQETAQVCVTGGTQYQVGEFACIPACHQQRRLARCDVVAEATSWTYVSDACPSAMIINPPWPSDWSEVPAVSAMSPIPVTVTYSAFPPQMPVVLATLLH
jgi:hypothetical protein